MDWNEFVNVIRQSIEAKICMNGGGTSNAVEIMTCACQASALEGALRAVRVTDLGLSRKNEEEK